jgi:hypothetical protein
MNVRRRASRRPARLTAEVDVNREGPPLNGHGERAEPAQDLENEQVVSQDIGVHGGHTAGPSTVE